jgi:uncharacterized membrane protein
MIVAATVGKVPGSPYSIEGFLASPFQRGFVALLIGGLILFIGIHLVPAFPGVRGTLAAKLGENGYKILFSVVSVAGLILTGIGYGQVPYEQIFEPSQTARTFLPVAMAIAFILVAVANIPGRIRRLVRHPMLAGVLIWAALHLLANGDLASNILFGAFALWAVFAILSAEQRGKRLGSGQGSFKADLAGAIAGLAVFAIVFYFHADLFGVSPV